MVQVLADPTYPQHAGHAPALENGDVTRSGAGRQEDGMMSREEHAQRMKELDPKRGLVRTPRRGWSMTEYQGDASVPQPPHTNTTHFERQPCIPENAPLPPSVPTTPGPLPPAVDDKSGPQVTQLPRRPKLPPPRRSYSVMDYEPAPPNQPKPSPHLTLLDLPSEVHYLFCDYLDPIDSVCFGLAHSKLYAIHRRKHGTVPLTSRYSGPNDMEWAWRGAGRLMRAPTQDLGELARMRVKGQIYCRKCGVSRCELHRHLKEWMGARMEYCEIKEMYGSLAREDAKPYCYMSSPKNPNRCGRHDGKKTA